MTSSPHDPFSPRPSGGGADDTTADPLGFGLGADIEVISQTPDRLRVLLIEDDPDHAALTEAYLAEAQDPSVDLHHASTMESGADALEAARAAGEPFHAVLTDQQLPDSAYWETAGRVVNVAGAAPVIALTSLGDMDVALEALRSGASDYLVKSELTPELLRRTLRYAVERSQRDEALRTTNEALRQTLRHVRQMQTQIVEQEKLAGLGRLLSGVAHELRNPLGLAVNAIEAAADEADQLATALPDLPDEVAETLRSLRDLANQAARNGRRADDVVRSMYDHARGVEGEIRPVGLGEIIRAAAAQTPASGVDLQFHVDDDVEVYGSGSALTRMLANILENAVFAAQNGGGTVRVQTEASEGAQGVEALLIVEDDGPGLDEELGEQAFEPFKSAWPSGRRIGLGLTIAHAIVAGHSGRIELSASELGGLRVRVCLPASEHERSLA